VRVCKTVANGRAQLVATEQIAQSTQRTGRDGRRINTRQITLPGFFFVLAIIEPTRTPENSQPSGILDGGSREEF